MHAILITQLQAIEVRTEKMRAEQKRAEPKRAPLYWFQAEEIKPRVAPDPNDLDNTPIDTIFAWHKGIFVVLLCTAKFITNNKIAFYGTHKTIKVKKEKNSRCLF